MSFAIQRFEIGIENLLTKPTLCCHFRISERWRIENLSTEWVKNYEK